MTKGESMKRILVATDGSEAAGRAVDMAAGLAKTFSAELIIVSVEQGSLNSQIEVPRSQNSAGADDILYGAPREILSRARAKVSGYCLSSVRVHAGLGDAAGFVLEIAEREKPDIIVVGKRGQGRLSGLLVGSVSQKLVSLAPCKVMVVP